MYARPPSSTRTDKLCPDGTLFRAVEGDDELDPVGQHHRYASAASHAAVSEVAGHRVGLAVEVGEGPVFVAETDSHTITEAAGGALEAVVHEGPRHASILLIFEIDVNLG